MIHRETVELTIDIDLRYLPVITGMVEQSAKLFGLDLESSQRLGLAIEELFNFLATAEGPHEKIGISIRDGGYYVEARCQFHSCALPKNALNVTKVKDPYDESVMDNLGLVLAARVVDHLHFGKEPDGTMSLRFTIDKAYPEQIPASRDLPTGTYAPGDGGNEDIKQFTQHVLRIYPRSCPEFFMFPGKVVDMVRSQEFDVQLALDGKGNVGGGMLWKRGGKMIDAFGPYIFVEQPGLAEAIVHKVLENVSRKGAICMVIRMPTPDAPRSYFEELASVGHGPREGICDVPLYRQLDDDTGSIVYVHPDIEAFVRENNERLVLPREIVIITYSGEFIEPHSLFGVYLDRKQHLAVLSTIIAGRDAGELLAQYISTFHEDNIERITFELDLGIEAAQTLVPSLHQAGFAPCYVLPWGGVGDVVVFELRKK